VSILFLPIDIEIPKIDTIHPPSTIIENGKYQPFWNTSRIDECVDKNLKFILDQLPFDQITNIYYKEQKTIVAPHYDVYPDMKFEEGEYKNILDNEPAGYRLVLEGSTDVLYVNNGNTFELARLPFVPCCYLLNSTAGLHKVKDDPGRKIIYVRGFINPDKHKTLIDKSLKLYKDFALYDAINNISNNG
jgi:hypothetical protein